MALEPLYQQTNEVLFTLVYKANISETAKTLEFHRLSKIPCKKCPRKLNRFYRTFLLTTVQQNGKQLWIKE